MNRYLSSLILALFVLCSSEVSRSQVDTATCIINGENWCDSTVVVPYNVFPLLGFTFGHFGDYDKINQWKKYGLNGIHAPERKGIDLAARFMTNGLYAEERFHDLIDDDAFGDLSYVGHWSAPFQATETRFFLTSNEKALNDELFEIYDYETKHNWKQKAPISITNLEALIDKDDEGDSLGYILRDLDTYGEGSLALDGKQDGVPGYYTIAPQFGKAICDFIYRFDSLQLSVVNQSDTLFQIEYYRYHWVDTGLVETHVGNSYIRGQDYTSYVALSPTAKNEHENIYRFPDSRRYPGGGRSPKQYALSRHTITWDNTITPVRIDCRVKRIAPIDIYVRGLRIRSELADKILKHDSEIVARIQYLCDKKVDSLKGLTFNGVSSWSKVKYFTAGNEPIAANFRPLAEVDMIVKERTGKNFVAFFSNNLWGVSRWSWYRTIYEDQTGTPPPVTDAENLVMFSTYFQIPYPKDGIKAELYTHPTVFKRGWFLPLTGDSNKFNDAAQFPVFNYQLYTHRLQSVLDGVGFQNAPYAGYPPYSTDQSLYKPWRAHLSTILTVRHPKSIPADDDKRRWLFNKFYGKGGYAQECAPWSDTIWRLTDESIGSYMDSFRVEYRSPLESELRLQLWNALCYGAKGVSYNCVSSDGAHNIGMLPLDGEPFDFDTSGVRQLLGPLNVAFGTCDDPLLGPRRFPADTLGWRDHLIIHPFRLADTVVLNQNGDTVFTTRFIPVFSDVAFTSGAKSIAIGDPILEEDVHNYVRFLQTHSDVNVRNSARAEYPDSLQWRARKEFHGVCKEWVWNAYDSLLSATHCSVWGEPHRYGYDIFHTMPMNINTYSGFEERLRGILRTVEDIRPIATYLKEGVWQTALKYSDAFMPGSGDTAIKRIRAQQRLNRFPIRPFIKSDSIDRTSSLVRPDTIWETSQSKYTVTSIEPSDSSYYELGLFKHPADSQTYYVAVANRRTWPVKFFYDSVQGKERVDLVDESGTTPQSMLGAVDVRQFSFYINTDVIRLDTFYNVKNLRSGEEWIKRYDDTIPYSIFLEPGEGTLLEISPARSFIAGRVSTAGMEYNNGHRLAEIMDIPQGGGLPHKYRRLMTWEREGSVQYAVINSPFKTGFNNWLNPDSILGLPNTHFFRNTLDSSGAARNPSVAAKTAADTVAIVWSRKVSNSRKIFMAIGRPVTSGGSASIEWFTNANPLEIATEPIVDTNDLPTPVVTPLRDGFFVAWAGYQITSPRIRSAFVNFKQSTSTWMVNPNAAIKANTTPQKALFPTIATRKEEVSDEEERIHLAWEEWTSTSPIKSHIYYGLFTRTYPSSSTTFHNDVDQPEAFERVSKGHTACRHHHPNIAIQNKYDLDDGIPVSPIFAGPVVTWEAVTCDEEDETVVLLRSREGPHDVGVCCPVRPWGSFTEFYKKWHNYPALPLVRPGQTSALPASGEAQGVVFQDVLDKKVVTERQPWMGDWVQHKLYDEGQQPSVSLPYLPLPNQKMTSITFRGALQGEDGLYSARITARDSLYETAEELELAQIIHASKGANCNDGAAFIAGGGTVGCVSCPDPGVDTSATNPRRTVKWEVKDLWKDGLGYGEPGSNTSLPTTSGSTYPWPVTEDSIRTNYFSISSGDVLRYDRAMLVFDEDELLSAFTDFDQYLKFEVLLKDSATGAIVDILESFKIKKTQVLPKPPLLDFIIDSVASEKLPIMPCLAKSFGDVRLRVQSESADISLIVPTSGKGYLTIRATKDTVSDFELDHIQSLSTDFVQSIGSPTFPTVGEIGGIGGLKKAEPEKSKTSSASNISIDVFPNPFSTHATVELTTIPDAPTVIDVFDVAGQKVVALYNGYAPQSGFLQVELNRDELPDGTYYVRVVSGGEVQTRKIVVIK